MSSFRPLFDSVSLSKFVPPQPRGHFVLRERLVDRLRAAADNKVVLVYAPEGYGKTLLLSSWYYRECENGQAGRFLWFKIDERDRDPECFWGNFVHAMEACWPGIVDATIAGIDAFALETPAQLSIMLANYIVRSSQADANYYLVFDDFERFKASDSEDQLSEFASMLPDNVHLIIASKAYLSGHLIEMDAYSRFAVLDAAELAMTQEEEAGVIAMAGIDADADLLGQVHRLVEGWPLAVHLFIESCLNESEPRDTLASLPSNHVLSEIIFGRAVKRTPPQVSDFLMRVGYFESISESLCDYTFETRGTGEIIRYLARNGLFLFPLDRKKRTYRFHPLFGKWLRTQALSTQPRATLRSVNHRATYWYHLQDEVGLAAKHAIAASEGGFAVGLTKCVFPHSLRTDDDILGWVFDLDAAAASKKPFFCLTAAWTFAFFGRPDDAIYWMDKAIGAIGAGAGRPAWEDGLIATRHAADDGVRMRMAQSCRVLKAKVQVLEGKDSDGIKTIGALLDAEGESLDGRLKLVLYQSLGEALELSGEIEEAMKRYRSALMHAHVQGFGFLVAFIRYQMARLLFVGGRVTEAEDECREALETCPEDFTVYGALESVVGYAMLLRNQTDEADKHVSCALDHVSADRNIDIFIDVCRVRVQLDIARNDYTGALYQATLARHALSESGYVPPRGTAQMLFAGQALVFAQLGDAASARQTLKERKAEGYRETHEGRYAEGMVSGALSEASPEQAGSCAMRLEKLAQEAGKQGYALYEIMLNVCLVRLWHVSDNHDKARRSLRMALDLARKERLVRLLLNGGETVKLLLAESVGTRSSSYGFISFAKAVLAAFEGNATKAAATAPAQAESEAPYVTAEDLDYMEHWGLTERELDVLRLLIRGVKRKGIAAELFTSQNTVKTHISHIYSKMNAHSVPDVLRRITEYCSE